MEKTTTFNLAARFAMRQKGAARLRALELELACVPEAEVPDETTGDVAKVPAKYDFGIQRIMAACEEMVGRSATDRKGELRERYCLTLKRGNSESATSHSDIGLWWLR